MSRAEELTEYFIGLVATAVFAITGVLAVSEKGIDLFGAIVLAIVTAIGGGTIRDLILNVDVFYVHDLTYIYVASVSALVAFWLPSLFTRTPQLLLYLDGFGCALFAIQSANKVIALKCGFPVMPIMLAVVTAIGGGLLRDVLAGRTNLLMTRQLYATPILLGTIFYVLTLMWFPEVRGTDLFSIAIIFFMRSAAIRWDLEMPDLLFLKRLD